MVTMSLLKEMGLDFLKKGREIYIPKPFMNQVDLLFDDGLTITAIVHEKNLRDYHVHVRVLMLLNQLCRYYNRPIVIHCISYRSLISQEKIYSTFHKNPKKVEKSS